MKNKKIPHPFLKWAGGKRKLIPEMKKYFPNDFKKYIEPFVGGGALFFYLYREKLLKNEVILIDKNPELINCYKVIKANLGELIGLLNDHKKNNEEYYYKVREWDRDGNFFNKLSDVEKASRTIFLNRCCYNGLYRVNSKGQFNVPFGRYKNPNFCDVPNLKAVKKALENVKLFNDSFELCLEFAEKNDFIYFDPPYHPLSDSSSFTSYTKEDFEKSHQKELFNVFKTLNERGCKLLLSNSYSKYIIDLYTKFDIKTIKAKRSINSDPTKRGEIKEVIIKNYDIKQE